MKKLIALACAAVLALSISGCASCDRNEIDWERTNYAPIGSGGYLPDKWAKAYQGSQSEVVAGYLLTAIIIGAPIGVPLICNGLYRASHYEAEGKKFEYEMAYMKQVKEKNKIRQELLDEVNKD